VVDDDPGLRAVLQLVLDDEGFTTFAAGGEQSGLAILESEQVDLVITDSLSFRPPYGEPQSGWLRELRLRAKGVPVVLLTGYPEATRLNPDHYGLAAILTKPFDLDALSSAIDGALGHPSSIGSGQKRRVGQKGRVLAAAH
jgi:two-component system nitrogen regulation response regulator NtrX